MQWEFQETSGSAINEYDSHLVLKSTHYLTAMQHVTQEFTQTGVNGFRSYKLSIFSDEGKYSGYVADARDPVALMRLAPERSSRNGTLVEGPLEPLEAMELVQKYYWHDHSPSGDTAGGWTRKARGGAAAARVVDLKRDPSDPTVYHGGGHFSIRRSNTTTETADWTVDARRIGRCYGRAFLKEGDKADDALIDDERVDLMATPSDISPDGRATVKLRVTCDQVPIRNAEVQVGVEPQENSGGHIHTSKRPYGFIDQTDMNTAPPCPGANNSNGRGAHCIPVQTGADGTKTLTFRPGVSKEGYKLGIAGVYEITARPKRYPSNGRTIAVVAAVKGLSELSAGDTMILDGQEDEHPDNHYGTQATLTAFEGLAAEFQQTQVQTFVLTYNKCGKEWPIAKMKVNDIALRTGGLFDAGNRKYPTDKWWRTPHQTHGYGRGGDFDHYADYSGSITDCNGKKHKVADDLGLLLLALGEPTYGCWDRTDLAVKDGSGHPAPMWHLHVEDRAASCGVPP